MKETLDIMNAITLFENAGCLGVVAFIKILQKEATGDVVHQITSIMIGSEITSQPEFKAFQNVFKVEDIFGFITVTIGNRTNSVLGDLVAIADHIQHIPWDALKVFNEICNMLVATEKTEPIDPSDEF